MGKTHQSFFCLLIAIPKNEEHGHLTAVYKNLEYPENIISVLTGANLAVLQINIIYYI